MYHGKYSELHTIRKNCIAFAVGEKLPVHPSVEIPVICITSNTCACFSAWRFKSAYSFCETALLSANLRGLYWFYQEYRALLAMPYCALRSDIVVPPRYNVIIFFFSCSVVRLFINNLLLSSRSLLRRIPQKKKDDNICSCEKNYILIVVFIRCQKQPWRTRENSYWYYKTTRVLLKQLWKCLVNIWLG